MAPVLQLTTQLLLSLGSFDINSLKQAYQNPGCHGSVRQKSKYLHSALSSVSWGYNRMDVFGLDSNTKNVSHKLWGGYQWDPSVDGLESLGGVNFSTVPSVVTWGVDRLDIFAVGPSTDSQIYHKYWDGKSWEPVSTGWEGLGGELSAYPLAVTSWDVNRFDIFGVGPDGELYHKYWDGSSWSPSGVSLEPLAPGTVFITGTAAVSWGPNRNDIFGLGEESNLLHIYWDGSQWSKVDDLGGSFSSPPTAISWGKNRLDVFAVDEKGALSHKYWDGYQWSGYEDLGGSNLQGQVAVTSWTENRLDIVALGDDGQYYYKYWDGAQWNPSVSDWYAKHGNFTSVPSVVSWGENRLDIYGIDSDYQLAHQTWYGSGWYPEVDKWEQLGGPLVPG